MDNGMARKSHKMSTIENFIDRDENGDIEAITLHAMIYLLENYFQDLLAQHPFYKTYQEHDPGYQVLCGLVCARLRRLLDLIRSPSGESMTVISQAVAVIRHAS